MHPELTTPRLRLSPLTESQLTAYRELLTNPVVAGPAGLSLPVSAQRVAASLAADRQQPVHYGIVWPATNRLIGTLIGYPHVEATGAPSSRALDVGYLLAPEFWGRGLMPEALTAWLAALPRQFPQVTTVWATTLATNTRSQRVLIKSAFELIDDQMMAPNTVTWGLVRHCLYRYQLTE